MQRCVLWMVGAFVLNGSWASAAEPNLKELLPRIPHTDANDTAKTFTIQHGFTLELVASEPNVADPIDAAFDEDGKMYVVEMRDYPFLPEQRPKKYVDRQPEHWGSVRLLEDTDGDGKMDKSVVFADKLRWPQSVCCYNGGVFVLTPPSLFYLKDTNGDGVADVREEWFTGFNTDNVQALTNGMKWHLDHGIYFAGGRTGANLQKGDEPLFVLGRRDLRLDPKQKALTPVSGGEQFGHTIDDWGNRFVCNNSNHLEQIVIPARYLDRNPLVSAGNVIRTIAAEGAAAPVYRKSPPEPWRIVRTARRAADPKFKNLPATELVATGFFTSATGITVYRGAAYPPEYQGNVFIGDVGGNLVHRKTLRPNGVAQIGERTEQNVEFIASTDNWFRPTNFVNAPDGTLYVLDMYWETIEHPASIPEDIKEHLDLESGNDRGRVYRLVSPGMKRFTPPKLGKATALELVEHLKSPHGWVRDTAHRLLWERQDAAAVPALKTLVRTADGVLPVAIMQALYSLSGLNALTTEDVLIGLNHAHPRVREHAILLSERITDQREAVLAKLVTMTDDADLRVKWQLAFSLGEFSGPTAIRALAQLAKQADKDADLRLAILTSVGKTTTEFGATLLSDPATMNASLAREVARMVGSTSDDAARQLLQQALGQSASAEQVTAVAMAVGEGTRRRGVTLTQLAEAMPADSDVRKLVDASLQTAANVARQADASVVARIRAVTILGYVSPMIATEALSGLLSPQTPPELQQAAVKTLLSLGHKPAEEAVLAQWKGLGPAARKEAIDGLTQSRTGAAALLTGLVNGTVKTGEIDRDKQQFLMSYPQPEIRDQAKKLLGGAASNRKDVVTKYQPSLELTGDAVRGQAVHQKICMQCHRAGTSGHAVGPDLVSVQNKSPDDLLIAILDPNREAQPIFVSYTASTEDGKVYTGLIAAETAASVTLRRAEAKEDVVLRNQLEELVSNGVSLMPEGMEKDLSPQQVADVIAFIKSLAPPAK